MAAFSAAARDHFMHKHMHCIAYFFKWWTYINQKKVVARVKWRHKSFKIFGSVTFVKVVGVEKGQSLVVAPEVRYFVTG